MLLNKFKIKLLLHGIAVDDVDVVVRDCGFCGDEGLDGFDGVDGDGDETVDGADGFDGWGWRFKNHFNFMQCLSF